MGGDFGPSVMIPAVETVLHANPAVQFKLFGNKNRINTMLSANKLKDHPNIEIFASHDDVEMTDKPSYALKSKKQSSMRMALESVRDGQANACVSAGNTGALMAISRFILKMLPGIDRPAIISAVPSQKKLPVYLLDLGANVECDEVRLTQFAIMGNELSKALHDIQSPRVGLLNVGEEDIKGSDTLRKASVKIEQVENLNYVGFVEANQLFSGDFQVIVTDGFTGNNVLKASEGLSNLIMTKIKHAFERTIWSRLVAFLAWPMFRLLKDEFNPEKYNGACLIGLRGIVIKSHGSANVNATICAINEAILQAKRKLPSKIKEQLALIS